MGRTAMALFVSMLALAAASCGNSSGRIDIHGKVTYLDQPVAKGTILFYAKDGAAEAAPIIDGTYATAPSKGLVPVPTAWKL